MSGKLRLTVSQLLDVVWAVGLDKMQTVLSVPIDMIIGQRHEHIQSIASKQVEIRLSLSSGIAPKAAMNRTNFSYLYAYCIARCVP